jgi:hypothetical protein
VIHGTQVGPAPLSNVLAPPPPAGQSLEELDAAIRRLICVPLGAEIGTRVPAGTDTCPLEDCQNDAEQRERARALRRDAAFARSRRVLPDGPDDEKDFGPDRDFPVATSDDAYALGLGEIPGGVLERLHGGRAS